MRPTFPKPDDALVEMGERVGMNEYQIRACAAYAVAMTRAVPVEMAAHYVALKEMKALESFWRNHESKYRELPDKMRLSYESAVAEDLEVFVLAASIAAPLVLLCGDYWTTRELAQQVTGKQSKVYGFDKLLAQVVNEQHGIIIDARSGLGELRALEAVVLDLPVKKRGRYLSRAALSLLRGATPPVFMYGLTTLPTIQAMQKFGGTAINVVGDSYVPLAYQTEHAPPPETYIGYVDAQGEENMKRAAALIGDAVVAAVKMGYAPEKGSWD